MRVLWRFLLPCSRHRREARRRDARERSGASREWGNHLNLKGPKFEVLSRPKKKFIVPSPGPHRAHLHEKSVLRFLRLHTRHHGTGDSSHSRKLFQDAIFVTMNFLDSRDTVHVFHSQQGGRRFDYSPNTFFTLHSLDPSSSAFSVSFLSLLLVDYSAASWSPNRGSLQKHNVNSTTNSLRFSSPLVTR